MLVSVDNVTLAYEGAVVLERVSFEIKRGDFCFFLGRTGSGKTSLLKLLYADLFPCKGRAQSLGYKLHALDERDVPYLRRQLGIVFQDFQLLTDRSVEDNLYFVLKATGWQGKFAMKKNVAEALGRVGLDRFSHKKVHQLSGGGQQRLAIARALLNQPALVLADEPTGNLDPATSQEVMELFAHINQQGTAIVMATHNHGLVQDHSQARVFVCQEERVEETCRKKESHSNPVS